MKVVEFKSNYKFYIDERCGGKPNTTRVVGWEDERFTSLRNGDAAKIVIRRTGALGIWFMRSIENVTFWKPTNDLQMVTISWKHEEVMA